MIITREYIKIIMKMITTDNFIIINIQFRHIENWLL